MLRNAAMPGPLTPKHKCTLCGDDAFLSVCLSVRLSVTVRHAATQAKPSLEAHFTLTLTQTDRNRQTEPQQAGLDLLQHYTFCLPKLRKAQTSKSPRARIYFFVFVVHTMSTMAGAMQFSRG